MFVVSRELENVRKLSYHMYDIMCSSTADYTYEYIHMICLPMLPLNLCAGRCITLYKIGHAQHSGG